MAMNSEVAGLSSCEILVKIIIRFGKLNKLAHFDTVWCISHEIFKKLGKSSEDLKMFSTVSKTTLISNTSPRDIAKKCHKF